METTLNQHNYKFFLKARDGWEAIYEACKEAKTSILFEHYILIDDKSGRLFIDLFKEKTKEGIRVKIILDAIGSTHLFQFPLEKELRDAGVEIIFFNTIIPGTLRHYTPWFFRDHRKVIVVDSSIGFTGGLCFDENMRDWRDTCVRIEGPVVSQMEKSFYLMLSRAKKESHKREQKLKLNLENHFAFLTNAPFLRQRHLYYELLEKIKHSRYSINFTTPYFVPNIRLLRGLCRASRRGVSVSILIPTSSDHPLTDIAAESYFNKLLKSGVNIFRGGQPINHTKAGTIDGNWGTLGSLNLDYVSLRYNFEANLVTNEKKFISALNEQFTNDCMKANRVEASLWHQRPLYKKILEFIIGPIRFLL